MHKDSTLKAMQVFNTIAPVFLMIGLGAWMMRRELFKPEFLEGVNRLTYWIGLPALLVYKVADARFDSQVFGSTLLVLVLGVLGSTAAGYLVSWMLGLQRATIGTFVQLAFRGNIAFLALPILLYSLENVPEDQAEPIAAAAVLSLGPVVALFNVISVVALLSSQHRLTRTAARTMVWQVFCNPLLIACVVGMVISIAGWKLPSFAHRTLAAIGGMSLPLALIGIGGTVAMVGIRGHLGVATIAALLKVVVSPLIGLAIAMAMGLDRGQLQIVLIFLTSPCAAASYVLAEQLGGDGPLTASAVFISTVLSIATLSVVVALPV
ncbi:MAG: AEC family transporter [Pirellulales bacterium]|nr:AEC family transporter [Pirellulales bacterium]